MILVGTYVALERHALVDREDQNDVSTSFESFDKGVHVVRLSGPGAVPLGDLDVLVIPGLYHKVPITCSVR